jgi:hypothetical protein
MPLREGIKITVIEEDQWTLFDEPLVLFNSHTLKDRHNFKDLMEECTAKLEMIH